MYVIFVDSIIEEYTVETEDYIQAVHIACSNSKRRGVISTTLYDNGIVIDTYEQGMSVIDEGWD